ncbi:MAG: glycosyltransferase family 4 protein [Gemmatimonadaceae bacterium]
MSDSRLFPPIIQVASGREWRGGQLQVFLLARGLHALGITTSVVTGTGTELARRLVDAHVPVDLVRWSAATDPRVTLHLVRRLRVPAVLHVHDSHAHLLADAAARFRRAPVVVTRRVTLPIAHPRRYQRAAALIAISEAVRGELLRAGVDPARIHRIPDAIDPGNTSLPNGVPHAPDRTAPLVVCVAALTPEKGIDTLIDAAALLHQRAPTIRWRVIGDGPERGTLEARRHRHGLDGVVELHPGGESAATAFHSADLVVQPSRSEGLGSAVLQALALGVPVIAADVGGLPDALAHGGGMLISPDSPGELAGAVERLLEDRVSYRRLSTEGRAAADFFSLDRLVNATVAVYRSLASIQGAS